MHRGISLLLTLLAVFSLTSCIEGLTSYSIQYPVNNGNYIGTVNEPALNDDGNPDNYLRLEDTFIVGYGSAPSGPLKISLNGNDIGKYFDYGPTQATADIEKIKQFFRQGRNTLSVELLSFGPQIVFYLDAAGPDIIVTRGESLDGGVTVLIEGFLRDASSFGDTLDVDLTQITGHDEYNGQIETVPQGSAKIDVNPDGSFSGSVTIDGIIEPEIWNNTGSAEFPVWEYIPGKSLLYTLRATDEHGYDTKLDVLADIDGSGDSLPINNALRIAVGDSFIESMRPVIAAGIYTALEENPISGGPAGPFKVDIGLGNMPTTVDYFHLASGKEKDPDYVKPADSPGKINWNDIENGPNKATILLNRFEIKEGSIIGVEMVITNVLAELTIEMPSALSWLIPRLELGMFIERINVVTDAIAQAAEGKVDVQLGESNFALQGIQTTEVKAGVLDVTALAGALIPLLEGLIGDLLPSIVNPVIADNLSRIVIGQRLYRTDLIPDDIDKDNLPSPDATDLSAAEQATLDRLEAEVPYTDFRIDVFNLDTGNVLGPAFPYDLLVGIQSKADTGKRDPDVKPILGTYFSDDPIPPAEVYNSLGNTGTNISMAVDSNLINQFLAGLYSIGQMHLTLHNGKTLFGANPNTPVNEAGDGTLAKTGDERIRLWPDMPPIFKMEEISGSGGVGKASITYPSATLAIEEWDGTNWNTDINLQVDFDLAILVDELDGAVTLGAAGPPVFNVNKIVNNTNIQVPEIAIQAVLDAAMFFGGDAIADQAIPINLNDLASAAINGTQVTFLDAADNYTLADANGDNPGECKVEVSDGVWGKCKIGDNTCVPEDNIMAVAGDGKGDIVCQNLEFVVQTDTVGTIGNKGSNLFFQMGARDPSIPAPPAVPRFDLDEDGIVDYRDNCAMSQAELAQVIQTIEDDQGISLDDGMIKDADGLSTGEPTADYAARILAEAEAYVAQKFGGSRTAPITTEDHDWFNFMRKNVDDEIANQASNTWLKMLYANPSQYNTDGDRIGELCEDDYDRDGVYADNVPSTVPDEEVVWWQDNCPHTPQLKAGGVLWDFKDSDDAYAYYFQTEKDDSTPVGDACDVRRTFVLLRSLESQEQTGTPRCLLKEAEANEDGNNRPELKYDGTSYLSSTMHVMLPCDPEDERQHFYMNSVNGVDETSGVEFFTEQTRDRNSDIRLVAYGDHKRKKDCTGYADGGAKTETRELRLSKASDATIKSNNKPTIDGGCGSDVYDRVDPIWWPEPVTEAATLDEAQHPWYIHTKFDFGFGYWTGIYGDEKVGATCMVWSPGWGVDINSNECPLGDQEKIDNVGKKGRWAIWVGGNDVPWNGKW